MVAVKGFLEKYTCPITLEIMKEPVSLKCGHLFERSAIVALHQHNPTCPLDRTKFTIEDLKTDVDIKNKICNFILKNPQFFDITLVNQMSLTTAIPARELSPGDLERLFAKSEDVSPVETTLRASADLRNSNHSSVHLSFKYIDLGPSIDLSMGPRTEHEC
jgi:hypothetical protein